MKNDKSLSAIGDQLNKLLPKLRGYQGITFFLFVAAIYGYILWQINTFSNVPASTSQQTTQTAAQPRIDQATIDKLQSLQDSSVSVQALFNQARNNPFQE